MTVDVVLLYLFVQVAILHKLRETSTIHILLLIVLLDYVLLFQVLPGGLVLLHVRGGVAIYLHRMVILILASIHKLAVQVYFVTIICGWR